MSWSQRHAFFDFAQNEDEFDLPSTIYLTLSEVEGRTLPMRAPEAVCTPYCFRRGDEDMFTPRR
jgi:hypothetical protein